MESPVAVFRLQVELLEVERAEVGPLVAVLDGAEADETTSDRAGEADVGARLVQHHLPKGMAVSGGWCVQVRGEDGSTNQAVDRAPGLVRPEEVGEEGGSDRETEQSQVSGLLVEKGRAGGSMFTDAFVRAAAVRGRPTCPAPHKHASQSRWMRNTARWA